MVESSLGTRFSLITDIRLLQGSVSLLNDMGTMTAISHPATTMCTGTAPVTTLRAMPDAQGNGPAYGRSWTRRKPRWKWRLETK